MARNKNVRTDDEIRKIMSVHAKAGVNAARERFGLTVGAMKNIKSRFAKLNEATLSDRLALECQGPTEQLSTSSTETCRPTLATPSDRFSRPIETEREAMRLVRGIQVYDPRSQSLEDWNRSKNLHTPSPSLPPVLEAGKHTGNGGAI